jgi:2-C-methyl-D-erythritol 4-phosphate cytidylyltransferase
MKKYAIIVAGGSGVRMGTTVPKQFLLLHGKPVLWYSLNVFLRAYSDLEIILVLPAEHMSRGLDLLDKMTDKERIRIVEGGMTRFHSVANGLRLVEADSVVFVHDGVRCLVSTALVHRCYEEALASGSAIPVIDSRDSIRMVMDDGNVVIDRTRIKLVQTPQTFLSKILLPAYQTEYRLAFTDEATVVEAAGHTVQLVEGEANNIKITMPVDLVIAAQLLEGVQ